VSDIVPVPATVPGATSSIEPLTRKNDGLRVVLASHVFQAGAAIVLFWIICAIFGPWLVPHSPYKDDMMNTLGPPSLANPFGTDQLGRDVLSRVIIGARSILSVAPLATLLGTVAGATLGLITGYFGGIIDTLLSRVIEALLALPLIIVALLALVALGPSTPTVIIVIGLIFTPLIARTVRAAVLAERQLDYVAAAELRGENALHIMFAEILPNVMPPILVETTVRLGYAIFTVASLSFLGFGIQPPSADWGLTISQNYDLITGGFWWTVTFDALAIASLVIGVNLVADGIQGALE
jgi:peptide/nickel transport system permease protein